MNKAYHPLQRLQLSPIQHRHQITAPFVLQANVSQAILKIRRRLYCFQMRERLRDRLVVPVAGIHQFSIQHLYENGLCRLGIDFFMPFKEIVLRGKGRCALFQLE